APRHSTRAAERRNCLLAYFRPAAPACPGPSVTRPGRALAWLGCLPLLDPRPGPPFPTGLMNCPPPPAATATGTTPPPPASRPPPHPAPRTPASAAASRALAEKPAGGPDAGARPPCRAPARAGGWLPVGAIDQATRLPRHAERCYRGARGRSGGDLARRVAV